MTLTADISTDYDATAHAPRAHASTSIRVAKTAEQHAPANDALFRSDARVSRNAILAQYRDRRLCLVGMVGPLTVFLALAAWYLSL